jgi:hypothetical protein
MATLAGIKKLSVPLKLTKIIDALSYENNCKCIWGKICF